MRALASVVLPALLVGSHLIACPPREDPRENAHQPREPHDVETSLTPLGGGVTTAAPLVLAWRMARERRRADAPPGDEYPALYVRAVTLTAASRTIALGDQSGSPESSELTYCRALGFRQPFGERWSIPDVPDLVASFTVATMQGSSDWLVIAGERDRLHVLARHTHDGACPTRVMQGPLEVCADMKWKRSFDLQVDDARRVREQITIVEDGGNTPFDCKQSYSGERLLPPVVRM
jgi:hypothetical protein